MAREVVVPVVVIVIGPVIGRGGRAAVLCAGVF